MKRKITILITMILAIILTFSFVENAEAATKSTAIQKYRKEAKKIEKKYKIKAVDSSALTYNKITHRKNQVLIERCIGKVKNKKKDGKLLNGNSDYGTYISYKNIKCKKGDIIVSYFLWNPENNAEDDVIARWDFVIKK